MGLSRYRVTRGRRLPLVVLAILAGPQPAFGQDEPPPPAWVADRNTGCKLWSQSSPPGETVTWSGQCKDGLASGEGEAKWSLDGTVRETNKVRLVKGRAEGQAEVRNTNGMRLTAEFRNGLAVQGTLEMPDGSKYIGQFDDRMNPAGQGRVILPDGSLYQGEFQGGHATGSGKMTFANGNIYVGQFKDDKFDGFGTFTYADSSQYSGLFKDGKFSGHGTLKRADGTKYIGNWENGSVSGNGVFYDKSGRIVQRNQKGSVRLVEDGGVFKVPVNINGKISLNFVIDSGAADVSVPADVVMVMIRSGTLSERDFTGTQVYIQADGSRVPSRTFRIQSLQVGEHVVRDVVGSVSDVKG